MLTKFVMCCILDQKFHEKKYKIIFCLVKNSKINVSPEYLVIESKKSN